MVFDLHLSLTTATAQGALLATTLFHPVRLHFATMLLFIGTQAQPPVI